MEYQDKVLKCAECGAEFVFTAGEQMFFADKGFKNEPKRCKSCKAKRADTVGPGQRISSEARPKRPVHSAGKRPPSLSSRRRDVPFTAASASSSGGRWARQPDR